MKTVLKYLFAFLFYQTVAQVDTNYVVKFHFDEWEHGDSLTAKAKRVGVSSCNDRFGNRNSACFFHGTEHCYVNLGTSPYLKPKAGSVSVWFRPDEIVFNGRGYTHNVIILTKSWEGDDFFEGYSIDYSYQTKQIQGAITYSEEDQIRIVSADTIILRKWYHAVLTYNDKQVCFYLDGVLQNKVTKKSPARFLATDSVMLGNSANKKNLRFFHGSIDDVEIYHRVLSPEEVLNLYESPNPNRYVVLKKWIGIVSLVIGFVFISILLVRARIRFMLKKEEEKNRLQLHALEQEIKMLKAQMDPHFIFNSMNTILQFIITNQNSKAEIYLTKFSKLIRMLLESNTNEGISLNGELDILKKYLEIEALRFDQIIDMQLEVEHGINTYDVYIPHMMIQPFVENAIWHGLRLKEGDRTLKVKFKKKDEKSLFCVIDDNGIGRNKDNNPIEKENRSLAINFIIQRLELMNKKYGGNYSLNVLDKVNERNEPMGTLVELILPIIPK